VVTFAQLAAMSRNFVQRLAGTMPRFADAHDDSQRERDGPACASPLTDKPKFQPFLMLGLVEQSTRVLLMCLEHTKQILKSKGKKSDTPTQTQETVLQTSHQSFTSWTYVLRPPDNYPIPPHLYSVASVSTCVISFIFGYRHAGSFEYFIHINEKSVSIWSTDKCIDSSSSSSSIKE
jgi:hypothetical protein